MVLLVALLLKLLGGGIKEDSLDVEIHAIFVLFGLESAEALVSTPRYLHITSSILLRPYMHWEIMNKKVKMHTQKLDPLFGRL